MKRIIIVAVAAGVVGILAVVPTAGTSAAPDKSPFVGTWTAVDNDGSNLRLVVHGGPRPSSVKITDDAATSCPSGGPASGIGKATLVDADTIDVIFRVRCPDDKSKTTVSRTFDHQSDDTLKDDTNVIWSRS